MKLVKIGRGIGKGFDNDVVLEDFTVSKKHCEKTEAKMCEQEELGEMVGGKWLGERKVVGGERSGPRRGR